ncbi:MAG: hypothetical protein ACK4YT_13820, partial [Sphingomonas sp.]
MPTKPAGSPEKAPAKSSRTPAAKASAKAATPKTPAPKTPTRRREPGQRDLFQLDSPLTGEIRGERS